MATKVYILLIDDRHCDTEVRVYADKDTAIATAKELAHEYDRFGDYEERQIDGWLFYARYSCEGDHVRVEEKELL